MGGRFRNHAALPHFSRGPRYTPRNFGAPDKLGQIRVSSGKDFSTRHTIPPIGVPSGFPCERALKGVTLDARQKRLHHRVNVADAIFVVVIMAMAGGAPPIPWGIACLRRLA